jgi:uncharacterized SAM-binding protein YcdF (DUF218 family)
MTFYPFSHYLQPWLLPPGINLLLMLLGLMIHHYLPRIGNALVSTGIFSLWLFSTPFVAYNMASALQDQYVMLQPESLNNSDQHDAILVLGGGDKREVELGNKLTASDITQNRLKYAAWLHQKTNLPIIVSGGKSHPDLPSEADLMATVLHDNYQINSVFKEDKSQTTAEESVYVAKILQEQHFKRVYLVTNSWHMPRSVYIFECHGINVTPAPMGYYSYGPGFALISFFPNAEALAASATVLHEYLGRIHYRLSYGAQCHQ